MTFDDVETARKAYYEKIKQEWLYYGIFAGIGTVIFLAIGGGSFFGLFGFLIFFSMIYLIIAVVKNQKVAKAYKMAYKSHFVERNLRSVFTDLNYHHDLGLNKDILKNTGMINTGDVYASNDFTSGRYKDVAFSQADVHIQEEHTDSDGNTTYVTIFKGRFMVFEFKKQFNFKLELVGKKFHAYRVPGKNATTGRKMEKISTESTEFNSAFRIFGEDGFEAYYILDPAFMVKILNIAEQHKRNLILCFHNNQLIIGLNDGKDSFEPPKVSKPIDEAKEDAKVASDIKTITDFVDQLALDRKLFKN